jgi:ATP-dependent protease HslVU (ClpYQ) peptidase subunit
MTCIAYRNGIIAADTQETFGTRKIKTAGKVARIASGPNKGHWLCMSGASFIGQKLVEWYADPKGREPPIVAADPDDDEALTEFLVITPERKLFLFNETLARVPFSAEFYAIGPGGDYAMGAMKRDPKCSAADAVRIACEFDSYCSLPLHIHRLGPVPARKGKR